MYVNQKCYVKWANKLSELFTVANGVKQGAVISPSLFSIYIDNFKELKQLGLGCHVGRTFAGTLEITLLMIFITEILYLVFVIFINETLAQFQTLMRAIVTL